MNERNIGANCLALYPDRRIGWFVAIAIFGALSFLGLTSSPPERAAESVTAPVLTVEEVAAAARRAAKVKLGEKMSRYVLHSVEFQPKYRRWRVSFEEKELPSTYDSCFKVFVNDHTKETEFQACP